MDNPYQKGKKVHITDDEMSGVKIVFTHLGDHKFQARLCFPDAVKEKLDFEEVAKADNPEDFTSEAILGAVNSLMATIGIDPNCMSVGVEGGPPQDTSNFGIADILMRGAKKQAKEQYKREVREGVVPADMTFEDWLEVATPDGGHLEVPDGTKLH